MNEVCVIFIGFHINMKLKYRKYSFKENPQKYGNIINIR